MKGPGSIFSRFSHVFWQVSRELAKNLPRTCRGTRCLPRSIIFGGLSTLADNFRGGWGGGGPPRGVSIRRPPKVEPRARSKPSSRIPISNAGRVLIPLSLNLSPGARGPPESSSKFAGSAGLGRFFGEFLPLGNVLQKLHRKNIEKSTKIEDCGLPKPSPNPSKMALKSTAPSSVPRRVESI